MRDRSEFIPSELQSLMKDQDLKSSRAWNRRRSVSGLPGLHVFRTPPQTRLRNAEGHCIEVQTSWVYSGPPCLPPRLDVVSESCASQVHCSDEHPRF